MYSRSYYPTDDLRPTPPENYDGTAFAETVAEPSYELPPQASDFIPEERDPTPEPQPEPVAEETVPVSGGGMRLPFLSGLSNIFDGGIFSGKGGGILSHIGVEEILIIAVAAFLLFSKDGDLECAVMLLLLLLIS